MKLKIIHRNGRTEELTGDRNEVKDRIEGEFREFQDDQSSWISFEVEKGVEGGVLR